MPPLQNALREPLPRWQPTSLSQPAAPSLPPPSALMGGGGGLGWSLCLHQRNSIILQGRVTPCCRPTVCWEEKLLSDKKAPFQAGPGVWAAPLSTVTLPQCQRHKCVGLRRLSPTSKGPCAEAVKRPPPGAYGNQTAACRPH